MLQVEQAKDKLAALHDEQAKTREQQRKEGKDSATSVDDRKALREFLKDACGINPAVGGFKHTVEAGKLVAVERARAVAIQRPEDALRALALRLPAHDAH